MDNQSKLHLLLDLAESLCIEVRRGPARGGPGSAEGGSLIRLRGKEILFLDTHASDSAQVAAVAAALAGRDEIEQMFLPPEIRQTIEKACGGE